jgi:lipopolysaccharide export system protein LptC
MFSKTLFIHLILIAMILLGTWYTWQQLTRSTDIFTERHQPDAYATQVILLHTDTEGNLHDQLKTPLSIHYPLDDSLSLTTPTFNLFLTNNETWQLSAKYGKLKQSNDHLQLWDNVILTQKKGSNANISSTLTTSILNINLKEKTADTAAPVTITQANQVLNAIGLHADFKTKTIRLLSQVKGQLKPTKSK